MTPRWMCFSSCDGEGAAAWVFGEDGAALSGGDCVSSGFWCAPASVAHAKSVSVRKIRQGMVPARGVR